MSPEGLVELAFRPAFTLLRKAGASAPEVSSAKADSEYKNLWRAAALKGGSARGVLP